MRGHVRKLLQLAIGARQFLGFFGQRLLGGFARSDIPREAERADDPAAAPRHGLGPLEFDHALIPGQTRDVGLDGGFADALLTRQRRKPQLIAVPGIHERRGLRVRRFKTAHLSDLNLHLLSVRSSRRQRRSGRTHYPPPIHAQDALLDTSRG